MAVRDGGPSATAAAAADEEPTVTDHADNQQLSIDVEADNKEPRAAAAASSLASATSAIAAAASPCRPQRRAAAEASGRMRVLAFAQVEPKGRRMSAQCSSAAIVSWPWADEELELALVCLLGCCCHRCCQSQPLRHIQLAAAPTAAKGKRAKLSDQDEPMHDSGRDERKEGGGGRSASDGESDGGGSSGSEADSDSDTGAVDDAESSESPSDLPSPREQR